MFDIAWSELLVIVVVAVVVVGPKDLPRLMRSVGQWAGRARAMADQFRRSFDDMARQSELDDLRKEVQKLQQPMTGKDYESFGISEKDFPSPSSTVIEPVQPVIEDVGAGPPKIDAREPLPFDHSNSSLSSSASVSASSPAAPETAAPTVTAPAPATSHQA